MAKFKIGDKVVIELPEDKTNGPGHNPHMQYELNRTGGRMTLLEVGNPGRGWWHLIEDAGEWVWDELWMKKATQFKGNIK